MINNKNKKNNFIFMLIQSLFIELSLHPKPGLITPISSNSHYDMDFFLMLSSIRILHNYFINFYNLVEKTINIYQKEESKVFYKNKQYNKIESSNKISHNIKIYNIPEIIKFTTKFIEINYSNFLKSAIECEKNLFQFTKGINTYKGIIFSFSILIIVFIIYHNLINSNISINFNNQSNFIDYFDSSNYANTNKFYLFYLINKIVGQSIVKKKQNIHLNNNYNIKSYGKKLRKKNIQGEIFSVADSGYKICFDTALYLQNQTESLKKILNKKPFIYKMYPENNKFFNIKTNDKIYNFKKAIILKGFCKIGSKITDSNIAGKKGLLINKKFNQICYSILNTPFYYYRKIYKKILILNKFCMKNNISPGGTADLLSYSLVLNSILINNQIFFNFF